MPGFSIRSARWGAPPNVAPPFPGKFLSSSIRHRYVKVQSGFFPLVRSSEIPADTQAYHPKWLTHLKSYFKDVFPLAPPPIPEPHSVKHLPYLKGINRHRVVQPYTFKHERVLLEDPGPPATTRPVKFLTHNLNYRRRNVGVVYLFGALGGDAVGPIPPRPKFLRALQQLKHRVVKPYTFRSRVPRQIVVPITDRIPTQLRALSKPHRVQRPYFLFKYRPRFVPTVVDRISLIEFFNLRIRLDVKKAVDSGVISAISTDAGGTVVNFNRAFKDVESIVGTVQETTEFIVVIDFVDVPNPTSFKVLVFNTAGTRVSKTVYWVARGII